MGRLDNGEEEDEVGMRARVAAEVTDVAKGVVKVPKLVAEVVDSVTK